MCTRIADRLSLLWLGLALLLTLGWTAPAAALSISPDPVGWTSAQGSTGSIDFLGSSVSGADTTLSFQLSHDAGSTGPVINSVDISVLFINPTGSSSGAGINDSVGGGSALFDFVPDLAAGATSSTFSVSYATAQLSEGQTINFQIDDGQLSNHPATISLVPEPAAGLFLALSGAALGRRNRRS